MQERHDVADWNIILTALNVVHFDDEVKFEEVKVTLKKG
jgi:hypothetical protein